MTQFKHLFTPLNLRSVEIRNRILSTGHQTYLARDGLPSDDFVAYHEARARGGLGLIITEAARFHASALSDSPELIVTDDNCIAGYRRVAAFLLNRPGTPTQLRVVVAHFEGDQLTRLDASDLPTEAEFLELIQPYRPRGSVPVLALTEDQIQALPVPAPQAQAASAPAPEGPVRSYPPLETKG